MTNWDGYYGTLKKDHPGRIYHDPRRFAKSTGNPCPMLNSYIKSYKWVEKAPTGYKLCGRCRRLAGRDTQRK